MIAGLRLTRAWTAALSIATILALGLGGTAIQAKEFRSSDVHSFDYPTVQAVAHMDGLIRARTDGRHGRTRREQHRLGATARSNDQLRSPVLRRHGEYSAQDLRHGRSVSIASRRCQPMGAPLQALTPRARRDRRYAHLRVIDAPHHVRSRHISSTPRQVAQRRRPRPVASCAHLVYVPIELAPSEESREDRTCT